MKEFYSGVNFYGHGAVLRKYAKFPFSLPLPVSVQHGWMMTPIEHDAPADASENWYWSSGILQKYKEKYSYIKGRAVGAPMLYCLANLNSNNMNVKRAGSIVFPAHSTELVKVPFDYSKYCDLLSKLPDKYKPITVCLYHNEIKEKKDEIFKKSGFHVVCNGYDPCADNFINNLILNLHDKQYFFSNSWMSAMQYASIMGLKVFLYGPDIDIRQVKSNDSNLDLEYSAQCWASFINSYTDLYRFPDCDLLAQYKIAERELGVKEMLSGSQMKALLWRLVFTPNYFKKMLSYSLSRK